MSLKGLISSLLILSLTNSAFAQVPGQNVSGSLPVNKTPFQVGPPPLPRVSILISAFRPFNNSETNMAQMVADSIMNFTRGDSRFKNLDADRIDLDVVYNDSSETLIRKIRSGKTPDIILSIGQGAAKGVTIETGADSDSSNFADKHGRGRSKDNFVGLSEEIGFNFPVQDMYCSVSPETRRKVSISYKGGNFVCNDLAYYMGNFVRPKTDIDNTYRNLEAQIKASYNSYARQVDAQVAVDSAAARAEFDRITLEEAPARAAYEQQVAGIRSRNAMKKQEADRLHAIAMQRFEEERLQSQPSTTTYQTSGGQVTVHRLDNNYGPPSSSQSYNSGYNQYPSQQPLRRQPPRPDYSGLEAEPYFPSKAIDRSRDIFNRGEGDKRQAKARMEQELRRIKELQSLLGTEGKTRFLFVHVPVSDGVAYRPKYNVLNAVCATRNFEAPGDWYDEGQAANYAELSVSALRTKARGFIAQAYKEMSRDAKDAKAGYVVPQRLLSEHPDVCEQPGGPAYEEPVRDYYGKLTGKTRKVMPPPRGRYFYSLRSYTQKAELRELSESDEYATTILEMINGALRRSQSSYPGDLPLPTFHNGLRMPRGDQARLQAITTLKNLGYGYQRQSQVPRAGQPGKFDTITTPIPPMMSSAESDCYAEVLRKMGQDQKDDKAAGPRRY